MSKPKNLIKEKQEKRKKENERKIKIQEKKVKLMKQESKEPFNLTNTMVKLFDNIADTLFKKTLGGSKSPNTAQETLPYEQIFKDGLARAEDGFYSKVIEFSDINYQLLSDVSKNSIYNRYCTFLNSIGSDVRVQLSFHTTPIDEDELRNSVLIKNRGDDLDEIRKGFSKYLVEKLETTNKYQKKMYITYGVKSEDVIKARKELSRVDSEFLKHFKIQLGSNARVLNGINRLRMLNELLRDNTKQKIASSILDNAKSGLRTKDMIAPEGFDFRKSRMFGVGKRWARASFFAIDTRQLHDHALADILDGDGSSLVSIHLEVLDQQKALALVKGKYSDVGAMQVHHNKKANQEGYGMDVLPPDLESSKVATEETLENLEDKDERFFILNFTVINFADTKSELDSNTAQFESIAISHGIIMKTLMFQQEEAFRSALPFAKNQIQITKGMTTSGVGGLVPFSVGDINMGRNSLHYGFNDVSGRILLVDRSEITNPNAVVVGIPGSGKSVSCKLEIAQIRMKRPEDDIIIVDPEGEYRPLVQKLGGEILRLSPGSSIRLNPLDINMEYGLGGDEEDDLNENLSHEAKTELALSFKADLILSLFEIILRHEVNPYERSIIDECMREVYKPYFLKPKAENIPILEDMYNFFMEYKGKDEDDRKKVEVARNVAMAMQVYVSGTLNYFNSRTNIDISRHTICFNIKDLQSQLQDMGMLVIQDAVWNRVTINRELNKKTWYFVDEFHLLLRTEQTSAYMVEIWKRFRKWGGIPTGITQNVKDFIETTVDARNILDNSPFIRIFEQSPQDAMLLANYLDIADEILEKVFAPGIGGGLLRISRTIIPFNNELPRDNALFKYIDTKPVDTKTA